MSNGKTRTPGTETILRHWREAVPDDRLAHLVKDATRALVRPKTSPWQAVGVSARERWVTLRRWVEAARCGALFGEVVGLAGLGHRAVAEQVMLMLAGRAGHAFGAELSESAFAGALIAA